jgi:hypothetical protein
MGHFGTASRLSAWTGVAPGNDEGAGKQRSGKTRKGNRTLRTSLTPMAHPAAWTKGTCLSALHQRLPALGGKIGLLAVRLASDAQPPANIPTVGVLALNRPPLASDPSSGLNAFRRPARPWLPGRAEYSAGVLRCVAARNQAPGLAHNQGLTRMALS